MTQCHENSRQNNAIFGGCQQFLLLTCWVPHGRKTGAKILFELHPKLKEAYELVNDLRTIFRNKKLTKETAREKLTEWYGKVSKSTLREIKSVKDSIKHYEDEILNYFNKRETNASAESLNSKMKCFRSSLRGVRDIPYFFYRSMMVFGQFHATFGHGQSPLGREIRSIPTFLSQIV